MSHTITNEKRQRHLLHHIELHATWPEDTTPEEKANLLLDCVFEEDGGVYLTTLGEMELEDLEN